MSYFSTVTGSSTLPYSSSIAIPIVGAPVTAQSVVEGFRTLADRTAYLSASIFAVSASNNVVCGQFYVSSSHYLTGVLWDPSTTSYEHINVFQTKTDANRNITQTNSTFTILTGGLYRANVSCYLTGTQDQAVMFTYAVNDVINSNLVVDIYNLLTHGQQLLTIDGLLPLNANDTVKLYARVSNPTIENVYFRHGTFTLTRL
jgi:hypothetical protein